MPRLPGGRTTTARRSPLRRGAPPVVALSFGALVTLGPAGEARADIVADADRVADQWRAEGLVVVRPPSIFLEGGRPRLLPLGDLQMDGSGCVTALVLGVRTADVSLRSGLADRPRPDNERGTGGFAVMTRCGAQQSEIPQAIVELRSPRAAVEVLLARGPDSASPVTNVLVERTVGPISQLRDPGRPPASDGLEARVKRSVERSKLDGSAKVSADVVKASDSGSGRLVVSFREGCHRLELLASGEKDKRTFDVDAELREASTDRLLARDRSDTPDARLEVCVAAPTTAVLLFGGGEPDGAVGVVDAVWELPEGLPRRWGAKARSSMARALWQRKWRAPLGVPAAESLGVSGTTIMPLELSPRSCYLAAVAPARGEARPLAITVRTDVATVHDTSGVTGEATVVGFCTSVVPTATVQVDARGAAMAWALTVWRTGRAADEEAPR